LLCTQTHDSSLSLLSSSNCRVGGFVFLDPPPRSASSILIIQAKAIRNTPGRNFIGPAQSDGLNCSGSRRLLTIVRTDPIFSHPDKTPWCHRVLSVYQTLQSRRNVVEQGCAAWNGCACALFPSSCPPLHRITIAQSVPKSARRKPQGKSSSVPGGGESFPRFGLVRPSSVVIHDSDTRGVLTIVALGDLDMTCAPFLCRAG
jgi:hypothetical protein